MSFRPTLTRNRESVNLPNLSLLKLCSSLKLLVCCFFFLKLIKRVVELYTTVKTRSSQVNEGAFFLTSLFVLYLSYSLPHQYLTLHHNISNKIIHCVIHGYNVRGRYIGGGRLEGTVSLDDVTHNQGQHERRCVLTYILSLLYFVRIIPAVPFTI